ncbi:MAG: ATP-binding protein [Chloroflexota bacterium]
MIRPPDAADGTASRADPDNEAGAPADDSDGRQGLGFRARLTLGLIAASVLPVAGFGMVAILVSGVGDGPDTTLVRFLLLAVAVTVVFAVLLATVVASSLGAPLREIERSVERVAAGDLGTPLRLAGDDELSRLAESHNRLARDLARRNGELRRILDSLASVTLEERPDEIARRAATVATETFGMISCAFLLVDPREIPTREPVPGEAVPVRVVMTAGGTPIGVAAGSLPATRRWERADEDLLELFVIEIASAIRNAQLYARVEDQNRRLRELDAAKDDFLRGVSHNLQTPLASIRGYAGRLAAERPDPRLGIITEQSDRLSRMVRQLLTVSRIESGALRSRQEVFNAAARVRRTWEALGMADVPFAIDDRSLGWLALGDPDQLDQVLWALLDNAVTYGGRTAIEVAVTVEPAEQHLGIAITDHGPGIPEADRGRLFGRFERGADRPSGEGSGLGLYVSRELCRAMGGELELAATPAGIDHGPAGGATFVVRLPAEAPEET